MNKIVIACLTVALCSCVERNLPEPAARGSASSARIAAPVQLAFDKALTDPAGIWKGTVSGDVQGQLETRLLEKTGDGTIWHVVFDWIVEAGDQSFTARLSGILNNKTGKVVMNGNVTEGYLLGAQVHEEGQLVNAATLQFQGSIRIMPATAP